MEATVVNHRVENWRELSDLMEKSRERGWLFRGETRCDRGSLLPKIGRPSKVVGGNKRREYSLESERRVFDEFKRASRPYISYQPASDIEWLALGQHHGLPTRLLDWTESLLVAAFFAVEKAGIIDGKHCDALIYGVQDVPEIADDFIDVFSISEVAAYWPPHISPRISAQRSVFTVHPNPTLDFKSSASFLCTISGTACWQIKRTLNASAINYGSMYPGIDGLCQQLDWSYKWEFFERKQILPDSSTA
jgi:hypothetical protein